MTTLADRVVPMSEAAAKERIAKFTANTCARPAAGRHLPVPVSATSHVPYFLSLDVFQRHNAI